MRKYVINCFKCKKKIYSEKRIKTLCSNCRKIDKKYTLICFFCKNKFKSQTKKQKFCSVRCANKNKERNKIIICLNCGKKKETKKELRFCNKICKKSYFSKLKKEKIKNKERIYFSDKLIKKIKFLYDNRCFLCKKNTNGISDVLLIHHIDKKPYNNKIRNLVLLCNSCHVKVHKSKEVNEILKDNIKYFQDKKIFSIKKLIIDYIFGKK